VIDRLRARDPGLPLVHVSSTSVFATAGQTTGAASDGPAVTSCDERTEARPDTDRGRLRLALERRVRERYPEACILRSAGIYGPGRSLAVQFRAGNFRRAASGNQYVSRIHVHDLVRLALVLIARCRAAPDDSTIRLVHAVDERPTANREVFAFLENELGLRVPGKWRDEPPRGRMIRSLYAADLLGRAYRYPTYVEGFRACL
jgi:nucleoside-diphosphate-sugar epimerase